MLNAHLKGNNALYHYKFARTEPFMLKAQKELQIAPQNNQMLGDSAMKNISNVDPCIC